MSFLNGYWLVRIAVCLPVCVCCVGQGCLFPDRIILVNNFVFLFEIINKNILLEKRIVCVIHTVYQEQTLDIFEYLGRLLFGSSKI